MARAEEPRGAGGLRADCPPHHLAAWTASGDACVALSKGSRAEVPWRQTGVGCRPQRHQCLQAGPTARGRAGCPLPLWKNSSFCRDCSSNVRRQERVGSVGTERAGGAWRALGRAVDSGLEGRAQAGGRVGQQKAGSGVPRAEVTRCGRGGPGGRCGSGRGPAGALAGAASAADPSKAAPWARPLAEPPGPPYGFPSACCPQWPPDGVRSLAGRGSGCWSMSSFVRGAGRAWDSQGAD